MKLFNSFKKQKNEEFIPHQLPFIRPKEKEKKIETNNKLVFILLLGSILLSLGVWGWGNITGKGSLSNPPAGGSFFETPTPTPARKTGEVVNKISSLTGTLQGNYGVYVYNLSTKENFGILQDDIFTAASLMKLPVILTLYLEVENGNLSLDTKYALRQEDKRIGAGSLAGQSLGKTYTYRQLVQLMGHLSDNTAYAAMSRILGPAKIQNVIDNLGMSHTSFDQNDTTPSDMGLFFRKLYGGSIVSREHRDEILSFITNTAYEDRIPAGVPQGVKVSHKIGNEIGVFSDAGIVFDDRPFVLVIMSKNALETEAKTTLPKITQAVWNFENQ
ncbi:MAG: serine hydrolase [bacterium]|nr:serine hydrolase [bacterium]